VGQRSPKERPHFFKNSKRKQNETVPRLVKLTMTEAQKIERINKQINRLNLQKNRFKQIEKTHSKQERRSRTRTLIQLGGLVEKSGLMELVNIQTGEDLQLDNDAFEKAATLFEILSESNLDNENHSPAELEHLKIRGIRKLKTKHYLKNE